MLEGKSDHRGSWWGCLRDVCFASTNSSERECFVPAGTHLGVKLLTYCMIIYFSHTRSLLENACSPICPSELIGITTL
jgi:hypothetical protein